MKVRGVSSNTKGKFTKSQVESLGLSIFKESETEGLLTITQLEREHKIKLSQADIDQYIIGFIYKKSNFGYSPVFDPMLIVLKGKG